MPISADNNRLYTEDGKAISLDEIAACLRDFRVTALGRDLGMLATSPYINPWAKRKPIDYGDFGIILTDNDRALVDWGMRLVGKYWVYQRPTSKFRVLDFDGYNHKAECPLQSTAKFNKTLDLNTAEAYLMQEIPIYPSGIVAYGENVELPLNNLTAYPYNNYIGFVFVNRNTGAKWYHSLDFKLKDCVEKTWEDQTTGVLDQTRYLPLANMPNTNNGDVVDVWYCLHTAPNVEYGTVYNGMIYFAMDETHGHFVLTISRFELSAFGLYKPAASGANTITFSYSGSSATITSITYDCQLNYRTDNEHFEVDTEYQFYVNGATYGAKSTKTLYLSDIQTGYFKVTKNVSQTISSSTLEANDYEVEVECRAFLANNTAYKTVMKYRLNVKTGAITNLP